MRSFSWLACLAVSVVFLAGCPGAIRSDGGADGALDARLDAVANGDGGDVADGPTVPGPFGARCTRDAECASGICLSIGRCSRTCMAAGDCPVSSNWACVGLPGRGTVCDCSPTSMTDLPCNNLDDDCNGLVDDTSRMCGATCVDVSGDPMNCGGCGVACGGGTVCRAGHCDCPMDRPTICGTRCVATATDPMNCGTCAHACTAGPNATPSCAAGMCGITCTPGFGNCDADAANGCEADVRSDLGHCGACGHACNFANATGTCSTGSCILGACSAGYSNCDGDPSNGCETATATSAMNCGTCGRACMPPNGVGACTAGVCDLAACNAGFANCNATAVDGCEANLASDALNCGVCGRACPGGGANASAACVATVCSLTCNAGYGDCDAMTANGCETSLQSNAMNCGACGNVCAAGMVCAGGACGVPCGGMPGYTNCGGVCVNPATDPANCGGCGMTCGAPRTCSAGTCSCPAGQTYCSATGTCSNLLTDPLNCGACGAPACTAPRTCSGGACACGAGLLYCAGTNSCANTNTDPLNCGACGSPCAFPRTCSGGMCGCAAGLTFCTTTCSNLNTDPSNCGVCGRVCTSGMACVAGVCTAAAGPSITCPVDRTAAVDTAVSLSVTAVSPGRTITGYSWTITASPPGGVMGATWAPTPPTAATESFTPGVVGSHTIHVTVTDSAGATASCDTHVIAQASGLRVEMTWDGTGDLDLHLHNGVTTSPWFSTPNDCYYANPTAAWGVAGTQDDGIFDQDSITGFGPEILHVTTPTIAEGYTIAVHEYSMSAAGRTATVRVFCGPGSTPAGTYTSRAFATVTAGGNCSVAEFWRVATVRFTTATACTLTPINTYGPSSAACTAF